MEQPSKPAADRAIPLFGGLLLTILAAASTYGVIVALAALRSTMARVPLGDAAARVSGDLLSLTMAQLIGVGFVIAGVAIVAMKRNSAQERMQASTA